MFQLRARLSRKVININRGFSLKFDPGKAFCSLSANKWRAVAEDGEPQNEIRSILFYVT